MGKSEEGISSGQTLLLFDRPHSSPIGSIASPVQRANSATYLPHGVAEVMKESSDHRAWHRAGRQQQAAVLLPLNPRDRGAGGKRGLDFHQGSKMAGDTLPETQYPEGLGEEGFPKPPSPGERPKPIKKVTGRKNTHFCLWSPLNRLTIMADEYLLGILPVPDVTLSLASLCP